MFQITILCFLIYHVTRERDWWKNILPVGRRGSLRCVNKEISGSWLHNHSFPSTRNAVGKVFICLLASCIVEDIFHHSNFSDKFLIEDARTTAQLHLAWCTGRKNFMNVCESSVEVSMSGVLWSGFPNQQKETHNYSFGFISTQKQGAITNVNVEKLLRSMIPVEGKRK